MITMRFDGSFIPVGNDRQSHSGIMVWAFTIERDGKEIAYGSGAASHPSYASSHFAEIRGLFDGLTACIKLGLANEHIRVCGDSQPVIRQMTGDARVISHDLQRVMSQAIILASGFTELEFIWESRDSNYRADGLCRDTLWSCRSDADKFSKVSRDLSYCKKNGSQRHSYPYLGMPIFSAFVTPNFA